MGRPLADAVSEAMQLLRGSDALSDADRHGILVTLGICQALLLDCGDDTPVARRQWVESLATMYLAAHPEASDQQRARLRAALIEFAIDALEIADVARGSP